MTNSLRYRIDAVPFSQFAEETGYNNLDDRNDDDVVLRRELRDHYLNFNAREIANQTGENFSTVRSQFGSAIDQYDRTLSEQRQAIELSQPEIVNPDTVPEERITAQEQPDSLARDLFDATAQGFTVGAASTISGVGLLGNTVARLFNENSEFGLDLADYGQQLETQFADSFDIDPSNQGFLTDVFRRINRCFNN